MNKHTGTRRANTEPLTFPCISAVCRDPCLRAGGDRGAHLPAGQLPGHPGLRVADALLPGESGTAPSTGQEVDLQERTARDRW